MIPAKKIVSRFGHIDIYTNATKDILYAIPHGYVGPSLVKKDLVFMADFDKNSQVQWTYIVDTSKVKVVNPLNPFFLSGLKQFSEMKEYVVYAPSTFVRLAIKSSSWINKPDRIIEDKEELERELQK